MNYQRCIFDKYIFLGKEIYICKINTFIVKFIVRQSYNLKEGLKKSKSLADQRYFPKVYH